MLKIAAERLPGFPLAAADAGRLPFSDASFDCVLAVTVLQHIPWAEQGQAVVEMARVLRPGASLVLFELLRGKGPHIFARAPEDWIKLGSAAGVRIVSWFGQEFLIFDDILKSAVAAARGRARSDEVEKLPGQSVTDTRGAARRVYWAARRISVTLSVWTEPVGERLFPQRAATHGVFVFQKPREAELMR